MNLRVKRLLLLLTAACATAPGAPSGPRTESGFPTRKTLEELAVAAPPAADAASTHLEVETWDLAGPFPEGMTLGPRAAEQPWDHLLDDAVKARPNNVASAGMHCAARELGRFYLEKRAFPSHSLQSFVLARCGAMITNVDMNYLGGEVSAEVTDELIQSSIGRS